MKTNQKSLLALVVSCVLLFSCSNDGPASTTSDTTAASSYEVVATTALPTTISTYITSKYVGSTTTEANLNSDGTYVAYVAPAAGTTFKSSATSKSETVLKLLFTAKGNLVAVKTLNPVAVLDLLTTITTYIATNYVGATIISAHLESDGSFDVLIFNADGTKAKLNFAADGTFVSASALKANGNHKHKHSGNHISVAVVDLLAGITTYISTNYTDATIVSAHKESDGSFDVFIVTAAGAKLNLNFTATGEFVSVSADGSFHSGNHSTVAIADLLADITTYINTNYAGATIVSAHKESDGTFDVYILTTSAVKLKLSFSATGVFITVKVDDDTHSEDHSPIAVADLSADILSYITTNYPNATILAAHNESEGGFEVYVQTATGTKLEIKFTAAGVFISVKADDDSNSDDDSSIAVADLLAEITTYITTNYPNATIVSAHSQSGGGFELYVQTVTGIKLEIKFTAAGVFVKAEKKN